VELKRGRLEATHHEQLTHYLDHARESELIRGYLDDGASLRGVLATVVECDLPGTREDVEVRIVDKERTIEVLRRLREALRD
jgi:hypothetical protein